MFFESHNIRLSFSAFLNRITSYSTKLAESRIPLESRFLLY